MSEADRMAELVGDDIAGDVTEREWSQTVAADPDQAPAIAQERAGERNKVSV
jgi:hypothetical protein